MRPFYGFMFHGQTISDALKFDQGSNKKYNFGEGVVSKITLKCSEITLSLLTAFIILHSWNYCYNSRVSRGNETNVKTQLFRREENKRLVSFCRGMFTLLTNLSVPRRNETNHNFIVISFIPSWNVFVCEENKRSMRECKQSGLS